MDTCTDPKAAATESLEHDPRFLAMQAALRGRPDWQTAGELALQLSAGTHDLRVFVTLARAQLAQEGVIGFAWAIALLEQMLARHWECVHAQIGELGVLAAPSGLAGELHAAPLLRIRGLISLSLADIEAARTGVAFAAADQGELALGRAALHCALASVRGIEQHLEQDRSGKAPDLAPLSGLIVRALIALGGDERAGPLRLLLEQARRVQDKRFVALVAELAGLASARSPARA